MRRLLTSASIFALQAAVAPAVAQTSSPNPIVASQSYLNSTIVPNGRGAFGAAQINQAISSLYPIFYSFGSWDAQGNFTLKPGVSLPPGTATSYGGVLSSTAPANNYATGVSNGAVQYGPINAGNVPVSLPANPSVGTVLGYVAYVDAYKAPTDPDDTLGIQRALTAAGINGHVVFQCHQYNVSATLQAFYNQTIEGCGPNNTILQRTGDYGDTLQIGGINGSTITPSFAFTVQGIWFQQSPITYASPQTALTNKVTHGAHLHFWGAQGYTIRDCWFSRMTYGIYAEGGTIGNIERNNFVGYYDSANPGAQEQVAFIYFNSSSVVGNPTSIMLRNNNFQGGSYPNRTLTYTSADPKTVTKTGVQPIGPLYNLVFSGCEDCEISGGYNGGATNDNIHMAKVATGTLNDIRIHDIHFDSAGQNDIYIGNVSGSGLGLTIHDNVHNSEQTTPHAVNIDISQDSPTPQPSMTNVTIGNEVAFEYMAAPFIFRGAQYVTMTGNTITGFNNIGASTGADPSFSAGIYVFGLSKYFTVNGNGLCGAGGNPYYGAYDATAQVNSASTVTYGTNGNYGCLTGLTGHN